MTRTAPTVYAIIETFDSGENQYDTLLGIWTDRAEAIRRIRGLRVLAATTSAGDYEHRVEAVELDSPAGLPTVWVAKDLRYASGWSRARVGWPEIDETKEQA